MRIVKHTSRFRRDYKREKSGRYAKRLDAELLEAVTLLARDEPLARRYFDHPLSGEWSDHRDCHITRLFRHEGRRHPVTPWRVASLPPGRIGDRSCKPARPVVAAQQVLRPGPAD